jgi:hypothetical protein
MCRKGYSNLNAQSSIVCDDMQERRLLVPEKGVISWQVL